MAFRIGMARRGLRVSSQVSLLALAGVVASCGARTNTAPDEPASTSLPGPSLEDAASSAMPASAAEVDAVALGAAELLAGAAATGGAWRVIEVPTGGGAPAIVSSPLGWLALSSRSFGDVEVPSGYDNVLYQSTDGVHWSSLPLGDDTRVQLLGLAYGAGRYVMSGIRHGSDGSSNIVWSSSDARQWTEAPSGPAGPVEYAHGRFFQVGFNVVLASEDGITWRSTPIHLLQEGGVAYGNGVYVLAANGPLQSSVNGWEWEEHRVDCTAGPMDGYQQCIHQAALFAEGRFYTEDLSSADGTAWQAEPGREPVAYERGVFFGIVSLSQGLPAWVNGGQPQSLPLVRPSRAAVTATGRAERSIGALDPNSPLPATVNVEFDDGLTCESAACVLVGQRLLLAPPAGTPPLIDRAPRTAAGEPLLTDQCPVSSQIWCDDYEARTGCVCHPEAPAAPASCQDVSQYQCAGRFTQWPNEWQLDEVAQGGCSCDAVDPNQPASFGLPCGGGKDTCQAPLACLAIDPIGGGGPPPLPRSICTAACNTDADCPSWQATGFCAGEVQLHCARGSCQPRSCH
jgi:hypothetical protein